MKYLVISDIHGSRSSASAVRNLLLHHGCSKILCLGDVLYHGPRNDLPEDYAPKEVITLLNPLAEIITGVRGNCDAEVDQMVLQFDVHSDCQRLLLGKRTVCMTHGHLDRERLFPLGEGDLLLSGHTHIPVCRKNGGVFELNPGSMTLPKENHPRTCGILDEEGFTVMKLQDQSVYMRIGF
jgi:putative phosphoesterase